MMVNTEYSITREVEMVEALRHFISMEATRQKCARTRDKMLGWVKLSDEKFIGKVHKFAKRRKDVNPALGWTIGVKENNNCQRVSHWVLANIQLSDLYSCGMNDEINDDLRSVKGNLEQFVKAGYARKHPAEFKEGLVPSAGKARIVIGIARESDRNGDIELVDGFHRVVGMLEKGITGCEAYIGVLVPSF